MQSLRVLVHWLVMLQSNVWSDAASPGFSNSLTQVLDYGYSPFLHGIQMGRTGSPSSRQHSKVAVALQA